MVLDLYISRYERRPTSVSSLCLASRLPGTAALRRIGQLVRDGMVRRSAGAQNRRGAIVELTTFAITAIDAYLDVEAHGLKDQRRRAS